MVPNVNYQILYEYAENFDPNTEYCRYCYQQQNSHFFRYISKEKTLLQTNMVVTPSQDDNMTALVNEIASEISKLQDQTFSIGGVDLTITHIERTASGL